MRVGNIGILSRPQIALNNLFRIEILDLFNLPSDLLAFFKIHFLQAFFEACYTGPHAGHQVGVDKLCQMENRRLTRTDKSEELSLVKRERGSVQKSY